MNNFLEKVDEIVDILNKEGKSEVVRQIENGKKLGEGSIGEIFDIICSILKTYEISNPNLFKLISQPSEQLFKYADSLGREPRANFGLLEELSL